MSFHHIPVLLNETIDGLNIKPDGVYVDGTLGGGGHAYEICSRLSYKGTLVGIDQDGDALEAAKEHLKEFEKITHFVRSNYSEIETILEDLGIGKADGIILDLGVSSYQLDTASRGFSYKKDAPLDMRMDSRQSRTAANVINEYSEEELCRVIRDYGEDPYAKVIAGKIVQERRKAPIKTTAQLSDIIKSCVPAGAGAKAGHPAKKTFQAIRIEVNQELEVLYHSIDKMIGCLKPGGRLCVITFHSLEDRIVKTKFRENENPCVCPPDFPVCVCGRKPTGRIITKKPVVPTEEEIENNRRAKSSKLRIFERI